MKKGKMVRFSVLALLIFAAGVGTGVATGELVGKRPVVDVSVPEDSVSVDAGVDKVSVRDSGDGVGNGFVQSNTPGVEYHEVEKGGYWIPDTSTRVVKGGSMRPAFWNGNTLLVQDYNSSNSLNSGTVVATDTGVVHVVVSEYTDSVDLKGYNSERVESFDKTEISSVVKGVLYTKQDSEVGLSAE